MPMISPLQTRFSPIAHLASRKNDSQPGISTQAATAPPTAARAYASPAIRFSGLLNNDYSVELRGDEKINAGSISAVLRGLQMRSLIKAARQDSSTLKFFMDAGDSNGFRNTDRAALADVMALVNRPVDVIIKSFASPQGVNALLSATGKRYMYAGAQLLLGPIENGTPYQRNDDQQIRREWNNEYIRDMEYLLMSRAGVKDRKTAFNDLMGARFFNSLEALYYGKKGLIDAIIVGHDRVVTRDDLEAYFRKRRFTEDKKQAFLKEYMNIYKLPSRELQSFSAQSIPKPDKSGPLRAASWYTSPKEKAEQDKTNKNRDNKTRLTFYIDDSTLPAEKIPLNNKIRAANIKTGRTFVDNPPDSRGILDDDVIFFNDGFSDKTAEQLTEALLALDSKKSGQKAPSHIKLMVNSPGGAITAGHEIRSTIESLQNKVDMVVTGMAASCGAFLLSSVTGNRLATPGARVMIHDAWWGLSYQPSNHYNEMMDSLDQVSRDFVGAIAQAAGRPFRQVWEDMKVDVWLNPLEAMFYGKRGLLDGILVGDNKVITREDVNAYLKDTLGNQEAVDRYIQDRLKSLRSGKREWRPEDHNENDPFDNPLQTIEAVAARSAKPLESVPALKGTLPSPGQPIDHFIVVDKDS